MVNKQENSLALELPCDMCSGKGGYHRGDNPAGEWIYCFFCKGSGFIPTEEGKAIYEMIRHQLIPIVRSLAESH